MTFPLTDGDEFFEIGGQMIKASTNYPDVEHLSLINDANEDWPDVNDWTNPNYDIFGALTIKVPKR